MELFLQQQFETLLREAAGNFAERVVYRCGGPENALERLSTDPDGEGVHRAEFVTAFLEENLLNNTSGHTFILEALERRVVGDVLGGPVREVLDRLARTVFADVLTTTTAQLIQHQQIYS